MPDALKEYVLQMKLIVVNVQELKRATLLQMQESSLLRTLLLTYQAVVSDKEKEDILMEIFKFMLYDIHLQDYFQPILAYLMKEGQFTQESYDKTINYYLTPQQKEKMNLSLGDTWIAIGETRGEIRGELRGELRGKTEGRKLEAHLSVLKGCYRGYTADMIAEFSLLSMTEIQQLVEGFHIIKKAWQDKKTVITPLISQTKLTEEEVQFVLTCLEMPTA